MPTEAEFLALKSRISELESRVEYLYQHLDITYAQDVTSEDARVIDLLKQGNKIEAIKVYKEIHDCGLAEAKRAVDAIEATLWI